MYKLVGQYNGLYIYYHIGEGYIISSDYVPNNEIGIVFDSIEDTELFLSYFLAERYWQITTKYGIVYTVI